MIWINISEMHVRIIYGSGVAVFLLRSEIYSCIFPLYIPVDECGVNYPEAAKQRRERDEFDDPLEEHGTLLLSNFKL